MDMIARVFGCLLYSLGWLILVRPRFARCLVPSDTLVYLPAQGEGRDERQVCMRETKVKNIGTGGCGIGGGGGRRAGGEGERGRGCIPLYFLAPRDSLCPVKERRANAASEAFAL